MNLFGKQSGKAGYFTDRAKEAIYIKDGKKVSISDHGSKEIRKGFEKALRKKMGL